MAERSWEVRFRAGTADARAYEAALIALQTMPDACAADVGEVARYINTDKLTLIQWLRSDVQLAQLVASKVGVRPE